MAEEAHPQFTIRVLVRRTQDTSEKQYMKLVKICRDTDSEEIHIYLPDKERIDATGWVPEVAYKKNNSEECVDIVICRRSIHLWNNIRKYIAPVTENPGAYRLSIDEPPNIIETDQSKSLRNASERQEVSNVASIENQVLYRITFENGQIRLNETILAKPNFDSENELVFDFLFRNPNRKVSKDDIEKSIKRPIKKRLLDIVRTLGFRNELRTMFFPLVSKTAIQFINPITRSDFEKRHLKSPRLSVVLTRDDKK